MKRADILSELTVWASQGRLADLQSVAAVAGRLAVETARASVRRAPWPEETQPVPEGWTCRRCEMHRREYRLLSPCGTWIVNVRLTHTPKGELRVQPWTWARRVEGAAHEGIEVTRIPAVVDDVLRNGGTFRYTGQAWHHTATEPRFVAEPLKVP